MSTEAPRRARRVLERTDTPDDSDALLPTQTATGQLPETSHAPRRRVRRQPTGDTDFELMAAVDAASNENDEEQSEMPPGGANLPK